MNFHPYITGADRNTSAADRMDVFGPGTDPAGLGTLGAPVNPAHVFDYLGENLPPFGNPQEVVARGAASWERGFEQVYGGRIVSEERDRFSPNTTTITTTDAMPVVSRPDELTEVKNNAQIVRERMARSVRSYPANPAADALSNQVSADAELRNLQNQAVSLVYESQMDALRATHLAAKSRGAALRGESIGAMPAILPPTSPRALPSLQNRMLTNVPAPATRPASGPGFHYGEADVPPPTVSIRPRVPGTSATPTTEAVNYPVTSPEVSETYLDSRVEPTRMALVLGGVAVAAAIAYFAWGRK